MCFGPNDSTVRNSVEGISLHSNVLDISISNNMQSLTKTVYNEVHAQRSLAFLNVGVYSSYRQWIRVDRRESSAQRQFGHDYNASWHTYRRTGSPY